MSYFAVDLSKRSTGWAFWRPTMAMPIAGNWKLGDPDTHRANCALNLNRRLSELWAVNRFSCAFVESPIAHKKRSGTSERNVRLALALHGMAEAFFANKGILNRFFEYSDFNWRKGFLGTDENKLIRRAASEAGKSSRDPLKVACLVRCRQLGIEVRNDDQADAVGILTYGILQRGVQPPWLANEVLRAPLEIVR